MSTTVETVPKISVIVPVYNEQENLGKGLEALLKQQYTNLEILLVDDCSNDGTKEICKSYAEKDNRIRVFYQEENKGVSAARNRALQEMSGRFVAFMDADDIMEPDMLVRMMTVWVKQQCDMVICNFDRVYSDGRKETDREPNTQVECMNADMFLEDILLDRRQGYLWNKLLRADIIQRNNLRFDESLAILEDFKFLLAYISYTEKICYMGRVLYHYAISAGSLSRRSMNDKKMTLHQGSHDVYELVKKEWADHVASGCIFYMNTHIGMLYDCYMDSQPNQEYIAILKSGMQQAFDKTLLPFKIKLKYYMIMYAPRIFCLCKKK